MQRAAFPDPPRTDITKLDFTNQKRILETTLGTVNAPWDRLSPVPCTLNTNNTHQIKAAFNPAKARAKIPPTAGRSAPRQPSVASPATRQQREDHGLNEEAARQHGGTARREASQQRQELGRDGPRGTMPPCCGRRVQGRGVCSEASLGRSRRGQGQRVVRKYAPI